jgi:hypothetical protein
MVKNKEIRMDKHGTVNNGFNPPPSMQKDFNKKINSSKTSEQKGFNPPKSIQPQKPKTGK